MQCWAGKLTNQNQDCWEKYQHLRYEDDATLMVGSKELESLLKVGALTPRPQTIRKLTLQFSSVQFGGSVMSDSLQPREFQHARPPTPSPTPGVHSNSDPLSQ